MPLSVRPPMRGLREVRDLREVHDRPVLSAGRAVRATLLLAVCGSLLAAGPAPAHALARHAEKDTATIGVIEIEGALPDRSREMGVFGGGDSGPTLRDVVDGIDRAARNDKLRGLVIKLKEPALDTSDIEELAPALQRFRDAGKKVHVYAYGYGTSELLLASHADEVIIQDGGAVSLPGIYVEEMYLADTLAWAGLKADMVQVGDYKGAADQVMYNKPSDAWNQNIDQLLDSLYGHVRTQLKAGRKLDDQRLDAAMNVAWLADAADARKAGLVDTILDLPGLDAHLESTYGATIAWNDDVVSGGKSKLDTSNPFALFSALMTRPERKPKKPTIAVVHIDGPIIDGDSTEGGLFGGSSSVGSLTVRRALAEIEDNDLIKGVVVRIDSPGGSAIASEVIWQGLRRVADAGKPVWVSVGSMAASGGYYILAAGQQVYVNPTSIVGSIGVVGGKISPQGLFDTIKIRTFERARGPRAAMFGSKPWSDADKAAVREKMVQTYELFTQRVTAGRAGIDLSKTAEGRLFTGDKAIGLKMADKIGGLDTALDDLAAKLGLEQGAFEVFDYPQPKSFEEMLQEAFGMASAGAPVLPGVTGELVAIVRAAVGERAWGPMSDGAQMLMQLRDQPVLLATPKVLIFR